MELEIGLKFKKFNNERNINNIDLCEVRGLVDNFIIILLCKKKDEISFYLMIDKYDFDFHVKNKVYLAV